MAYSKPGSCADLEPKTGRAVIGYIYRGKRLILPMILGFAIGKRTEAAWPSADRCPDAHGSAQPSMRTSIVASKCALQAQHNSSCGRFQEHGEL